jgi:ABC-type sugar transport system permease subunit
MASIASTNNSYTQPPQPGMWQSLKNGVRQSGVPWLFILPSIFLMFFITFLPQAYQVYISFFDFRAENLGGNAAAFVGLQNFTNVITGLNVPNYAFFPLLGFNLMWTIVNVAFHAGIGLAVAMALNAKTLIGRRIYRVLFVLPWALPGYITALIWNNLWQRNDGGFNLLLAEFNARLGTSFPTQTDWLGSFDRPIDLRPIMPFVIIVGGGLIAALCIRRFMTKGVKDKSTGKVDTGLVVILVSLIVICGAAAVGTLLDVVSNNALASNIAIQFFDRAGAPVLSFYAVLLANIWLGWPFMMVVATGALQSIPPDLYEAADVDGAPKTTQFMKITLPMIRPAMVPAIMLGTIWTFNQFNVIYFITSGGPRGQTDLLITQSYKLIQQEQLYGAASAFSIIVFFVLLIITLINNRITKATKSFDEA